MLYHNFKFLLISDSDWCLEYLSVGVDGLKILEQYGYSFSQTTPLLFDKHPNFLKKIGTFLIYHEGKYPELAESNSPSSENLVDTKEILF